MGFSIFISYSTQDLRLAAGMKKVLDAAGSSVYLAEYSAPPGVALTAHIAGAIKACDLFILLWSTHSKSSEWVPQEIGLAQAYRKQILPVVLEPGLGLPGFIRDIKYLRHY